MFLTRLVIGIWKNTFVDDTWYSVEGLQDIANLHDETLEKGKLYTVESLQDG